MDNQRQIGGGAFTDAYSRSRHPNAAAERAEVVVGVQQDGHKISEKGGVFGLTRYGADEVMRTSKGGEAAGQFARHFLLCSRSPG